MEVYKADILADPGLDLGNPCLPNFWNWYTPENYHGYPKSWLGKGSSLETWQFLVSMLVFGPV